MFAPSAIALYASSQISAIRFVSPSGPSSTGHVMSIVCAAKMSWSTWRSVSSSWLRRIGWSMIELVGVLGRLGRAGCARPRCRSRGYITISSRIGSIGGFVTCAKSCLK